MPLRCDKLECYFDEWAIQFFNVKKDDLFELMLAANFLDVKPLFTMVSVAISQQLINLNVEQAREFLYIKSDWKPEEEKRVQEENEIIKQSY